MSKSGNRFFDKHSRGNEGLSLMTRWPLPPPMAQALAQARLAADAGEAGVVADALIGLVQNFAGIGLNRQRQVPPWIRQRPQWTIHPQQGPRQLSARCRNP